MYSRRFKTGYFVLEGFNSFSTILYFYYFYFFMQKVYGYGNGANLALAALNGAFGAFFSWYGGRFAQRRGYFTALKVGFGLMLAAWAIGAFLHTAALQIAVMLVAVTGMSFTWPTLEALVSEGETRKGVQHNVGIYNIVWASTGATAYFTGGALFQALGFKVMYLLPAAIQIGQLALTLWLESEARKEPTAAIPAPENSFPEGTRAHAQNFLRMAWLANPMVYISINTLVAVMPGIAGHLGLSTMAAGFCGSLWCFARVIAFVGLWQWSGWHYRFRWLIGSYSAMVASFAAIVLAPNLALFITAQLIFGAADALIYYSSLFYAMDVGEAKGEHGGIHEAAIGVGNTVGPMVGAGAFYFLPQYASSGTVAVVALLVCGGGGLVAIRKSSKNQGPSTR